MRRFRTRSILASIIGEYHYLLQKDRAIGERSTPPYSIGVELETGRHVFHVNLSNSGGIGGAQYLSHTRFPTPWTEYSASALRYPVSSSSRDGDRQKILNIALHFERL